jgi:nicotinamide-nucleotide amidase
MASTFAAELGQFLQENAWTISTAESCTGGGVAAAITDIVGSSAWFQRGYITYCDQAKIDMLNVSADSLMNHGAVSQVVARQMAEGALQQSRANVAVATTGIAGPGGGSIEKPVGMVCFAWAFTDKETVSATEIFSGDRASIRAQAIEYVLQKILNN